MKIKRFESFGENHLLMDVKDIFRDFDDMTKSKIKYEFDRYFNIRIDDLKDVNIKLEHINILIDSIKRCISYLEENIKY
jgi:hypothetical protein